MKKQKKSNRPQKPKPDPIFSRVKKHAINNYHPRTPKRKHYYQKTPVILLDHEIDSILEEAKKHGYRDYTLIFFALNTGLRNSEVIGLDVEDVYPFGSVVEVLDLPARIAKGNKPRSIPLNDIIRDVLEIYLFGEFDRKRISGGKTPLFRSKWSNKRLGRIDFYQILERHSINSIHRSCNPHMLRHTFATKLIGQANIKVVQEILGHAGLQSTQVYLHPSSSDKLDAVNKLNFAYNRKE
ncbi:Tyrosine recombinase XerC [subsurface metagenome]